MTSIVQDLDNPRCYVCGKTYGLEEHHCLAGVANRKLSEKYGLKVWLCHDCHTGKDGAQYNKQKNLELKQVAQEKFEAIHGHEKWMEVFKKNYL